MFTKGEKSHVEDQCFPKVVFVLVALGLLVGVFAINFMLPGHAIELVAGRPTNNIVYMLPGYAIKMTAGIVLATLLVRLNFWQMAMPRA